MPEDTEKEPEQDGKPPEARLVARRVTMRERVPLFVAGTILLLAIGWLEFVWWGGGSWLDRHGLRWVLRLGDALSGLVFCGLAWFPRDEGEKGPSIWRIVFCVLVGLVFLVGAVIDRSWLAR